MFKLWSEIHKKAKDELAPDFGFRSWGNLSTDDKYLIWKYLEWHFFKKDESHQDFTYGNKRCNYQFFGNYDEMENKLSRVVDSVTILNLKNKARSYARRFLEDSKFNSACEDFYRIFSTESENVVFELLSLYSSLIILERNSKEPNRNEEESDNKFKKRTLEWRWEVFDEFTRNLNEVFVQFGIRYYLTRNCFVPRQDEKIMEEIYKPVLSYLLDEKWKEVDKLLVDAFDEYRKNTPQSYSNCITHAVSAVQAFLQMLVNNKIGGSEGINFLIKKAQEKGLMPADNFSSQIFKNIDSILMSERGKTGDAHPKKEYANEKSARLVLNLIMIFLQHCIQHE